MKTLLRLLSLCDQSRPYTGYPHYGPKLVKPAVGTKPPTFDHWAAALNLPPKYSTAALYHQP